MRNLILSLVTILSFTEAIFAQQPGVPDLRGTGWEGKFSQLGIDNKIRVGFLNETTSTGETPYFAYVPAAGVSSEAIGAVDKTCDYTPRLAKLFPGQPITGEIKVFACASSPNEERDLAADPGRPTILRARVSEFRISDDGKLITMKASILGVPVTYQLQRQPLPLETLSSRAAMHAWVVQ
jgi:hypothetical protein